MNLKIFPTCTTSDASRRGSRQGAWVLAFLLCVGAWSAAMAQPTVNGRFFGDGDNTLYSPYATSIGGSVLYSYYDAPTTTLYVALVVSHAVNDMVCSPRINAAYTSSATPPWGGHRSCRRASDSEFASFTFECAPGSPKSWSWQQALGCALNAGPPPSAWVSAPNPPCGPSTDPTTWPPGLVATTSWVANVNAYQTATPGTRAWNLYAFGTDLDNGWKSPFVSSAPDDVTQVPGYPTYSSTDSMGRFYDWEWSMVYEWSLNIGPTGVNCGNQPIFFVTGASHHSPPKSGPENDVFPPPSGDPTVSDFGDLPASYSTTKASGGARHYLKVSAPYLGQNIQAELDGVPTADASGDGAEEDGVTANVTGNWTIGSTQSITVTVANAPLGALLGGWFDWNNDGDLADPGEFFSWSVVQGTNTLNLTVGSGFSWQTDQLYARFRLFSSASAAPGGSLDQADFAGTATDGEVEDYHYPPGALPVTLNAFATDGAPGNEIAVRWQTASETDNVAFELWGLVNGEWETLTDLIASRKISSALPQGYEIRIRAPVGLTAIQLADYDVAGRVDTFGPFRLGGSYGEFQPVERIDWSGPRAEREARLRQLGFANTVPSRASVFARQQTRNQAGKTVPDTARWKKLRSGKPVTARLSEHYSASRLAIPIRNLSAGWTDRRDFRSRGDIEIATGPLTHVAVTTTGIQRVTYEALRDGGLDLAGAHAGEIAVTWRGKPVQRWIDGSEKFGPGNAIEFLGRAPEGEDALYIDANLYQVSVDRWRARSAGSRGSGTVRSFSPWYLEETWVDRPLLYHHQSPTGDPWVDRTVLVQGGYPPAVVSLDLPVEGPVSDALSYLVVGLGTITDLPELRDDSGQPLPEHNVEVWLARPDGSMQFVTSAAVSGQRDWRIEAPLPPGVLQPGLNRVELRFSTEYRFSLVVIDRYGVLYPTSYQGPRLDFAPDRQAFGYRIDGFRSPSVAAYAEGADGSLTRVELRATPSGGRYAVEFRQLDAERFWVTEAPHAPAVFTTEAPPDLFADSADLVVIAGSSFSDGQALADYLSQRADFKPVAVDVEDVYNAVGFGMALPSAITNYLALRNAIHPFAHVQLVGSDCYDRRNYVSGCVSFLPLPTARVGVSFYTPSQNRLVDLDGDGIGDKAVAQFSVRDEAELATIVAKGMAWEASALSAGGSALLIAEETDGNHDFEGQMERLETQLGWSGADMLRMAEHPDILTARDALGAALNAGRAVTTFSGHSSPTVWAFRALLTPAVAAGLTNHGRPTIMVPLACETTYDISPNANVLGHQLLFGGDQGALAISGAVVLANLVHNELMATHVLNGLKAGLTLGEAVLAGRRALGAPYQELQDNWLTQGDVAIGLAP